MTNANLARRLGALAAALVLLAGAARCASTGPKLPTAGSIDADKFLFERGSEALTNKKWLEAREYFRRLVDTYPQSQYRADAKLGLGDSYIGQNTIESNILAVNEFREFLTYFPLSTRADYAQYRIGLAHFRGMLSPQRDQTATREALVQLDLFLTRYPASSLRPEVEKLRRQARDRLSGSEFEVGRLYYRLKWCPGAVERFKGVLVQDPDYTGRDGVYFYLGGCLERMQRPAEALPYYDRLVTEFPKSEFADETKKKIALLKR